MGKNSSVVTVPHYRNFLYFFIEDCWSSKKIYIRTRFFQATCQYPPGNFPYFPARFSLWIPDKN